MWRGAAAVALAMLSSTAVSQEGHGQRSRGAVPLETIAQATRDSDGDTIPDKLEERVRVRAVVTIGSGTISQERLQLFLQDETGGVAVYANSIPFPIPAGSEVEVVGYVDQYRGAVQIRAPKLTLLQRRNLPPARPTSIGDAARWESYGELVEIEGVIGEAQTAGPYIGYDVAGDGSTIQVLVPPGAIKDFPLAKVVTGSRVRVTGVVSIYSTSPPYTTGFRLIVGSPAWFQLVSLPAAPWVKPAMIAAAVLIPLVVMSIIGMRRLRSRIHRRRRSAEALNALGLMAAGATHVDTFLSDSVNLMIEKKIIDGAMVHLLDGRRLTLQASSGVESEKARLVDERIQNRVESLIAAGGRASMMLPEREDLLHALALLPLQGRSRTLGVLTAFTTRRHPLTPEEAGLLAAAANLLALGIDNVQMLRESEEKQRDLEQVAISDPLTGLYNRRFMDEYVRLHLAMARRQKAPVAFLGIDLDHFKAVNDRYGHDKGDSVLVTVGELIRKNVRSSDLAVRSGGEEFIIVMTGTDRAGAVTFATRLQAKLREQPFEEVDEGLRVSASIGIAVYPEHGTTAAQLLRVADVAMYESKRQGRDRLTVGAADAQLQS